MLSELGLTKTVALARADYKSLYELGLTKQSSELGFPKLKIARVVYFILYVFKRDLHSSVFFAVYDLALSYLMMVVVTKTHKNRWTMYVLGDFIAPAFSVKLHNFPRMYIIIT